MTRRAQYTPESLTALVLTGGEIASLCIFGAGLVLKLLSMDYSGDLLRIGVWVIMLVPLFGALSSLVAFARMRETRAVMITVGVLLILIPAILSGLFLRH